MVGIVSGRLEHNQNWWHCGTAACVAGWNTNIYHHKKADRALKKACTLQGRSAEQILEGDYDWDANDAVQAKRDWQISEAEAGFMFDSGATWAQQIGLIEFLADGHRLTGHETWASHQKQREMLNRYVARYEDIKECRAWAKKWDAPSRSNSKLVKELLATKASTGKEVLDEILGKEETVKVPEICTLPSSR